ncbi:MAG: RsmE family RNA methyltransferase [Candidatus Rifleibacteriota bacterium]
MSFKVRIFETELNGSLNKDNRHRLERVMRLRPGDVFVVTDGCGHEAQAVLGEGGRYSASEWLNPGREPARKISLYAGLTKGEKFDWLVEKAVELGVAQIVPVISQNCVVKKTSEAKTDRWQKIALSAMLQCGGCVLPEVSPPVYLKDLPEIVDGSALVLYEQGQSVEPGSFSKFAAEKNCRVLTGPEGGFSPEEISMLQKRGWQTVWLGPRIFRAETTPLIVLSVLLCGSWGQVES